MGHQVEDLFALVTHQGQLVEGRLGGWRLSLSIWFSMASISVPR
jgi:hypothetical protein